MNTKFTNLRLIFILAISIWFSKTSFASKANSYFTLPDLVVSYTNSSTTNVVAGNPMSVNCKVKNQGSVSSGASELGYYLSTDTIWDNSDLYLVNDNVDPLSVNSTDNETANFTVPLGTASGNYYILFVADHISGITESNETNNVAYEPIAVAPLPPNLRTQVGSTYLSVTSTNVMVSLVVENVGSNSSGSFVVGYFLSADSLVTTSDYLIGTSSLSSISVNGSASASINVNIATLPNIPAGDYYLGYIIDYLDDVPESDETDNLTAWLTPQVTQPTAIAPDLIVQNYTSSLNSAGIGATVNVTCQVENIGVSTANASKLGYFLSTDIVWDPLTDIYVGQDDVTSLLINTTDNEATNFIIPNGLASGPYYILFVADFLTTVPEMDETNNVGYLPISINGNTGGGGGGANKPNLASVPGSEILTLNGTDITINTIIENIGTNNAGVSYIGYYLSTNTNFTVYDYLIGEDYVTSLAPGDTSVEHYNIDISLLSHIPPGTYYIGFIIDRQGVVNESDENDNIFHWIAPQAIQLNTNFPDLVSTQLTSSTNLSYQGDLMNLSVRVKNIGTAQASKKTYVGYYFSSDTIFDANTDIFLDDDDIMKLNPNAKDAENTTVPIPTNIPNGDYYILFVADYTNLITELNDTNNVGYLPITVDSTLGLPPFAWTPTNLSGVFLGQILVDTLMAEEGDWVAAIGPNGEVAGAAPIIINDDTSYINLTIYGDDPLTTTVDEGISAGEYFTLELYDDSDDVYRKYPSVISLYQFTQWQNTNGTVIPAYDSINTVYNFIKEVNDVVTFKPGWNLVSFDVEIPDSSITSIFSEVIADSNLEYITSFDNGSTMFDPNGDPTFNTLTNITRGFGYWVKVIAHDTVTVRGIPLEIEHEADLNAGWNLLAYVPQASEAPESYYQILVDSSHLEYVSGYDEGFSFFDPSGPTFLNTLTTLDNGFGYWIKSDTSLSRASFRKSGSVYTPTNTYDFVNGTSNLIEPEFLGKEIKVLDEAGDVVGSLFIIQNGKIMTSPLYGDDFLTTDKDGIAIGEKLYFDLDGQTLNVGVTFTGGMVLHKIDLQFNKALLTNTDDLTVESGTMKCFPVPFKERLFIQYTLTENTDVTIKIHNALGALVHQQVIGNQSAGEQTTNWTPTGFVPAGNYIISLEIDGQTVQTQQVTLMK